MSTAERGQGPRKPEVKIQLGNEYSPFADNWLIADDISVGTVMGEWDFNIEGVLGRIRAKVGPVLTHPELDHPVATPMGEIPYSDLSDFSDKSAVFLKVETHLTSPEHHRIIGDELVARFSFADQTFWSHLAGDDWVDDDDYEFHDSEDVLNRLYDGKTVTTCGFVMHRGPGKLFQVALPIDLKNPEDIKVSLISFTEAAFEMEMMDLDSKQRAQVFADIFNLGDELELKED